VLIALVGGIAMQRELDPTIPAGLLGDAMRRLLSTETAKEPLPSS
jgi:hypothetical protein